MRKLSIRTYSLILAFLAASVTAFPSDAAPPEGAKSDDGWVRLFNGKDLDGWKQRGGKARYRVEDDQIVGSSVPNTGNSFLCTKDDYGNFILELEFKTDPALNSGVQIRSHSYDEPQTYRYTKVVEGEEKPVTVTVPAGRVHGYQVEIDPKPRAWSGGIYDEGRRGWLDSLEDNEPARKAYKQDDWNRFRIECRGDSIKTWINGVPAADLRDDMMPSGFIALQVHGVGKQEAPLEVRFRDIRIKVLD